MEYYLFKTEGYLDDESLCLIEDCPEGMERYDSKLMIGERAKEYYPDNAIIRLRDENPGIKLKHLIGNLNSFIIGSPLVVEIVKEYQQEMEIEFLPFVLYNHKNRIHSDEYVIINPLGGFDCMNMDASNAKFNKDGKYLSAKRWVLDKEKLKNAPHLFRIDVEPTRYIISKELGEEMLNRGVNNFKADGIEIV